MDSELDLRVVAVRRESESVVALTFESADDTALPPWEPGAHISLNLPVGRRQYSLCGQPSAPTYTIAVLASPGGRGGSLFVHNELIVGATVSSRPPRNNFPLTDADDYLFIAGGIGITPILPMVRHVAHLGRPWHLVYGGRTLRSMAFLDDLGRYDDRVTLVPESTNGLLDLDSLLAGGPAGAIYCCGPDPLLRAVEDHPAVADKARLHLERFSASSDLEAVLSTNTEFDVVCSRSNRTVRVPADSTMLNALLEAGFEIESDCEEGICGTCELRLLAGSPDHRDDILTDDERETLILPCVSRAVGDTLTVEL